MPNGNRLVFPRDHHVWFNRFKKGSHEFVTPFQSMADEVNREQKSHHGRSVDCDYRTRTNTLPLMFFPENACNHLCWIQVTNQNASNFEVLKWEVLSEIPHPRRRPWGSAPRPCVQGGCPAPFPPASYSSPPTPWRSRTSLIEPWKTKQPVGQLLLTSRVWTGKVLSFCCGEGLCSVVGCSLLQVATYITLVNWTNLLPTRVLSVSLLTRLLISVSYTSPILLNPGPWNKRSWESIKLVFCKMTVKKVWEFCCKFNGNLVNVELGIFSSANKQN